MPSRVRGGHGGIRQRVRMRRAAREFGCRGCRATEESQWAWRSISRTGSRARIRRALRANCPGRRAGLDRFHLERSGACAASSMGSAPLRLVITCPYSAAMARLTNSSGSLLWS